MLSVTDNSHGAGGDANCVAVFSLKSEVNLDQFERNYQGALYKSIGPQLLRNGRVVGYLARHFAV